MLESPTERRELLSRTRTIAVLGVSPRPTRPSYRIFQYVCGLPHYVTAPVNPHARTIDGLRSYASLEAYRRVCGAPDLVVVFRAPGEAAAAAREAVAAGARAIWFQLGVATEEAVRVAGDAGLDVVPEACLKIELQAMASERHERDRVER
ncbi:MAG: CoA-binding protein [Vulcanimicrobiaceae bacterium]